MGNSNNYQLVDRGSEMGRRRNAYIGPYGEVPLEQKMLLWHGIPCIKTGTFSKFVVKSVEWLRSP